jgi:hypothetical protein
MKFVIKQLTIHAERLILILNKNILNPNIKREKYRKNSTKIK